MKAPSILQKIAMLIFFTLVFIGPTKPMGIKITGSGKISGTISHATSGKPLKLVSVTVYSSTDSSMVAGTITNEDGNFLISMLNIGNYYIEIGDFGFEKKLLGDIVVSKINPKVSVGEIKLRPTNEEQKHTAGIFGFLGGKTKNH